MFTKLFWFDAAERSIATFAQTLLALLSTDGLDITNLNFGGILTAALFAGVLSLLKSIVALNSGGNSASFTVQNVKQKGMV